MAKFLLTSLYVVKGIVAYFLTVLLSIENDYISKYNNKVRIYFYGNSWEKVINVKQYSNAK